LRFTLSQCEITSFVYDGDGNRVKKEIDDGQTVTTTVYVNGFYEVTGDDETSSYYLGGRLVAQRKGVSPNFELNHILQ